MPACKFRISNIMKIISSNRSKVSGVECRSKQLSMHGTQHPTPILSHTAFELHTQQALCFDCKLHWQLQENILAKAVDNQRYGVFLRDPPLLEIKELLFANLGG